MAAKPEPDLLPPLPPDILARISARHPAYKWRLEHIMATPSMHGNWHALERYPKERRYSADNARKGLVARWGPDPTFTGCDFTVSTIGDEVYLLGKYSPEVVIPEKNELWRNK